MNACVAVGGSGESVKIRWEQPMSAMQQKVNENAKVEMENERKVSKLNLSILFLKFLNTYL